MWDDCNRSFFDRWCFAWFCSAFQQLGQLLTTQVVFHLDFFFHPHHRVSVKLHRGPCIARIVSHCEHATAVLICLQCFPIVSCTCAASNAMSTMSATPPQVANAKPRGRPRKSSFTAASPAAKLSDKESKKQRKLKRERREASRSSTNGTAEEAVNDATATTDSSSSPISPSREGVSMDLLHLVTPDPKASPTKKCKTDHMSPDKPRPFSARQLFGQDAKLKGTTTEAQQ